jgi:hypothetical protein
MNTTTPSASSAALPSAPAPDISAPARLDRNRRQLTQWLEQDRVRQAQPMGWAPAIEAALPWIQSLARSPVASMALGALTQAALHPPAPGTPAPQAELLHTGLGLVRRHPWKALLLAGGTAAVLYWRGSRPTPVPPP